MLLGVNVDHVATIRQARKGFEPDPVTLVPEKRQELTTEGGLDVKSQKRSIKDAIRKIQAGKIPVSLFINPDIKDINISRQIGSDMVEINTGMYANEKGTKKEERVFG